MTDYTDLARLKSELHVVSSGSSADDVLLGTLITAASRAWDRLTTGVPDASDYFISGSVAGEVLEGLASYDGKTIICYPHKPIISAVSSFQFQANIVQTLYSVSPARIDMRGPKVMAFPDSMPFEFPSKCRVTISYTGGLGSSITDLPQDMVEAVTILAIRFYREAETGLTDQIGVAELGNNVYTKALPIRVQEILKLYQRKVGWRYVA